MPTIINKIKCLPCIIAATVLPVFIGPVYGAPPALTTSSFTKHDMSFEQCQQKSKEILAKMNLEIEDHGNGTIGGFGEQSVAVVNCHLLDKTTYVQIAVSSQKEEAAEMIMHYLVNYLKTTASVSQAKPGYPPH